MNSDRFHALDEFYFKLLREVANGDNPSQRKLSGKLGLSLGKVNFIVNSLFKKGLIKAEHFKNSNNKLAYMYILTPNGINQKIELTQRFLRNKMDEYEALKEEIEVIKKDIAETNGTDLNLPV